MWSYCDRKQESPEKNRLSDLATTDHLTYFPVLGSNPGRTNHCTYQTANVLFVHQASTEPVIYHLSSLSCNMWILTTCCLTIQIFFWWLYFLPLVYIPKRKVSDVHTNKCERQISTWIDWAKIFNRCNSQSLYLWLIFICLPHNLVLLFYLTF